MPIRFAAVPALLVTIAFTAGCGGSDNGGSSGASRATSSASTSSSRSTADSSAGSESSGERETVKTAKDGELGTYLVDEEGKALYLFEKDKSDKSTCYGACAQVWPPVTTSGQPQAEGRAKTSLLSTSMRKDGKSQVVYDGHPLYYYAPDTKGTTKGQGLDQFGAEWYVLAPSGEKVEKGQEGGS